MLSVPEVLSRYEVPGGMEKFSRRFTTLEGLWRFCERADWMLWMIEKLRPCDAGKLRLFTCHCARRWSHHLTDPRCVRAIEAGEKLAQGEIAKSALSYIREGARKAMLEIHQDKHPNESRAAFLALVTLNDDALEAAKAASRTSSLAEHSINGTNSYEHEMQILAEQADDLRKLLGNPFKDLRPKQTLFSGGARTSVV